MAIAPKTLNAIEKLEDLLSEVKTRPFDMYILGPFLIWYGLRSKIMPKLARKLLISAGIWQLYYNWNKIRQLPEAIRGAPEQVSQIVSSAKFMG